jgi:hypothetical protein
MSPSIWRRPCFLMFIDTIKNEQARVLFSQGPHLKQEVEKANKTVHSCWYSTNCTKVKNRLYTVQQQWVHIATVSLQITSLKEKNLNLKTLSTFWQLGKAQLKSENPWNISKYCLFVCLSVCPKFLAQILSQICVLDFTLRPPSDLSRVSLCTSVKRLE